MSTKNNPRKKAAQAVAPSGPRWLLPTNHYNLMYWLAAGLVLPEGAMDKYYADCLRGVPGWLPLFRDGVPQSAQKEATAERGMAVLLEIDLTSISGSVRAITAGGEFQTCRFPDELPADVTCILIPAPLPAQRIRKVLFLTVDSLNEFRLRREELARAATLEVPLEVGKFPEYAAMDQSWLPADALPLHPELPIRVALREAAVLATLHHFGNRGELSLTVAKAGFLEAETFVLESVAFREGMSRALSHGVKREAADLRVRLFWGVVDHLRLLTDKGVSVEQAVLDYLDQAAANDAVAGPRLKELALDLRQSLGIGGSTIRELFEKHPGAFAHALLLFFLRRHTDELIDFDTPGITVTEADWLAAAVLFGLREDWRSSPVALRNVPGLYPVISQLMAKGLHLAIGTDVKFGASEPLPTLRELFAMNGVRSSQQEAAALEFARAMKWTDAIETRVQLGKGMYRLEVGSGGVQIFLPGEIKAVTSTVNSEVLLNSLAQCRWPVDAKVEAKVRDLLRGK